jgi:hypothetical protein
MYLTFFDNKVVIVYLIHTPSVLRIQIYLAINAHPGPCLASAIPQYVLAPVYEFDLRMLLAEFCALYVHCQVDCVWVPGSEKLSIWRRINVQELP